MHPVSHVCWGDAQHSSPTIFRNRQSASRYDYDGLRHIWGSQSRSVAATVKERGLQKENYKRFERPTTCILRALDVVRHFTYLSRRYSAEKCLWSPLGLEPFVDEDL